MKKKTFLCLLFGLSFTSYSFSQMGINTELPKADLDVNGDVQFRGEIKFGVNPDDEITTGKAGQYLMSQGPGLPPTWGEIEIPELNTGDYVLRDTRFSEDRIGLILTTEITGDISVSSKLDANWSVIDQLTTSFTTTQNTNRIMVTMQTVAQTEFGTIVDDDYSTEFIGGIFVGKKGESYSNFNLLASRPSRVRGGHYPAFAYTLISSFDNLAAGEYELVVAFQRKESTYADLTAVPLHLGKGLPPGLGVSNDFMNKSILRVDVFEPTASTTTP